MLHCNNWLAPTCLMGHSVARCIAAFASGSNKPPGAPALYCSGLEALRCGVSLFSNCRDHSGTTGNAIMKTPQDFVAFGQGNVEALVKSGQILATGMQDLTKHFAATAQASMEEAMSTFRALRSVKGLLCTGLSSCKRPWPAPQSRRRCRRPARSLTPRSSWRTKPLRRSLVA